MRRWITKLALVAAAAFSTSALAVPTNFSFTGNFSQDDEVLLFDFTVALPSVVTLRTWSFAGGTNAEGGTVERGGFDPILTLYDEQGAKLFEDDDGSLAIDPVTGLSWDSFISETLGQGRYRLVLAQYNNFGPDRLNGDFYPRTGQGNFTGTDCDAPGKSFLLLNVGCLERAGHWALDIIGVEQAIRVPEPAGVGLLGLGLLGIAGLRRHKA